MMFCNLLPLSAYEVALQKVAKCKMYRLGTIPYRQPDDHAYKSFEPSLLKNGQLQCKNVSATKLSSRHCICSALKRQSLG